MKKIKIITFHSAENAGASLQCYALQEMLKRMGCDVQIIDYQPLYLKEQYKIFINPFKHAKKENFLKSFLAFLFQNIYFVRRLKRKKKYKKFREQYLTLTREYTNVEELRNSPPIADVYICGSDQIWNTNLTGGKFDPAYFLDFGSAEVKRFSYAVSIGKKLLPNEIDAIIDLTNGFKGISFRENSTKDIFLPHVPNEKIFSCVDPTLLLNAKDWEDCMPSRNLKNNEYILVYGLEPDERFQLILDMVKEKFSNVNVMDISQCNLKLKNKTQRKFDFSPNEFLSFIHDAEFVITNSFHCTVFSVIFQKNFYTIPHSKSSNRMRDFLENFKLSNRLYKGQDLQWIVRYDDLDDLIMKYRKKSIQYLRLITNGDDN